MGWILLAVVIAWFVNDVRRESKKIREEELKDENSYYLNAYLSKKKEEESNIKFESKLRKQRIDKERDYQIKNNIPEAYFKSDEEIQSELDGCDRFCLAISRKVK